MCYIVSYGGLNGPYTEHASLATAKQAAEEYAKLGKDSIRIWLLTHSLNQVVSYEFTEHARRLHKEDV